jgi:hypothetical protein
MEVELVVEQPLEFSPLVVGLLVLVLLLLLALVLSRSTFSKLSGWPLSWFIAVPLLELRSCISNDGAYCCVLVVVVAVSVVCTILKPLVKTPPL